MGARGPGETKLETDRRHIRRRISRLEDELSSVMKVRAEQRRARIRREVPLVALIGYTNAGKSTLLNLLTGSEIHAENRLFDTLDITSRKFKISDTAEVILSDTVGFIKKLPHHLTRAFRATLEELTYADLILHVVDASDPDLAEHIRVSEKVMSDLSADEVPRIILFNKCDLVEDLSAFCGVPDSVCISAKTGEGRDELSKKICEKLSKTERKISVLIPYDKSALLDFLHRESKVLSVEYNDDKIAVCALADDRIYGRIKRELGGEACDEL
ncbi:MAG: GTPase HflX [Oscillospiraceae bacterium]|nr:GTPase HflX [Oscillospiraceae bacterium]